VLADGVERRCGCCVDVDVPLNGSTSLTAVLSNPNAATTLTGAGFDDALPGGLQIATPNGLTGSCAGGTITATAGGSHLTLSGPTLTAGASCTFSVDVTGIASGSWSSPVTPTANESGDGSPVSPQLDVVGPPVATPAFGVASTTVGAGTSLTLSITNPNASFTLTGVGLSLALPSGLVVATPNGLSGSCGGGTIGAAAASTTITLAGATLPGGAGCSFSVQVDAVAAGAQHVSVAAGSNNGDGGRRHGELLRRRRDHTGGHGAVERRRCTVQHVEPGQRHALDGGAV
jgi:hypothetical protein